MGLGDIDAQWHADAVIENGDCVVTTGVSWTADQSDEVLDALAEDGEVDIRRSDDGWRFELSLEELAGEAFADEVPSEMGLLGLDEAAFTISVTLPGEVVEQSRYTWEFGFAAADEIPESIYVETKPGGWLGPAAIGAIVAGALIALGALVTLYRHSVARRDDPATDPGLEYDASAQ